MIPAPIARMFTAQIRGRGDLYAMNDQIRIETFGDRELSGVAFGTQRYEMAITLTAEGLRFSCSCPYLMGGNGVCKHLWGLLLVADRDGTLRPLVGAAGLEGAPHQAGVRSAAARHAGHKEAPPWLAQVTEVRHTAHALAGHFADRALWPGNKRLVYIVDLTASQRTGQLMLSLSLEHQKKTGEWSAPVAFRHSRAVLFAAPDPLDQQVFSLLLGGLAPSPRSPSQQFAVPLPIAREQVATLLPALAATGRFRLRRNPGEKWPTALRLAGSGLWHPVVTLAPDPAEPDAIRLEGRLVRDGATWPGPGSTIYPTLGIVLAGDDLGLLALDPGFATVAPLHARGGMRVPASDADALLTQLASISAAIPLSVDASLGVRTETAPVVPVAEFRAYRPAPWEPRLWHAPAWRASLTYEYRGIRVAGDGHQAALFDPAARHWIVRDARAEEAATARLWSLCPTKGFDEASTGTVPVVAATQAGALWRELSRLGWIVEVEGQARRPSTGVRVQVRSGIDWFSLDGVVSFGDASAPLADVLGAMQRGETDVALSDGSRGVMGDVERAQLASLAATARVDADGARFARSQTALLDALLLTLPDVDADAAFDKARQELAGFDRVRAGATPRGFRGTLRPYQRQALGWFRFLRTFGLGGCLADDMGLGKTVQVLALLESRRAEGAGCSLAVVPRSLVFNWMHEAARFAPKLRVVDWSGAARRGRTFDAASADLVLTTYGTLRRDALTLSDVTFDYVILDEAQAIKNASTASAKAARLLKGGHRLALSGTPVENRIEELWSLLEFLNPGMLGASRTFRAFAVPGDLAARAVIARALRPVILRRTKAQVAPELPERVEQTVLVELGPEQRAQYDALLARTRRKVLSEVDRLGVARTRLHVLEALLRLRQAACHPALLPDGLTAGVRSGRAKHRATADVESAKFEALLPMLAECAAEGHKALVFSQFTSLLGLLRARLDADGVRYAYLDGATRNRAAAVEQFQGHPECGLFLISLKAGGHGLNLTAAEYVFLLDPWWNPAVEAQAIDRAHRIGQTQRVIATRLVAANTVEEKIIELQQSKRALADAIIGGDGKGALAGIGREELELLLG